MGAPLAVNSLTSLAFDNGTRKATTAFLCVLLSAVLSELKRKLVADELLILSFLLAMRFSPHSHSERPPFDKSKAFLRLSLRHVWRPSSAGPN
jgi:hypothetical protein